MIEDKDITVVVQGPVQALPDRDQDEGITQRCLSSVREYAPGAKLILSTWDGQDLAGLTYDELVISPDPGHNIVGYNKAGEPRKENYNRQIVSSLFGLQRVETRYAMKLRSDNYLMSDRFKALQQRFPKRGLTHHFSRERVVTNNTFTRIYAKGMRVAFHNCDFFYFGLTHDVLEMWDLPLFEDVDYDAGRPGKAQHKGAPEFATDATQEFWLSYLNKHLASPIELRHLHDLGGDYLEISDQCYANNLVVAGPMDLGLGLPSKWGGGTRADKTSRYFAYMQHPDWQQLYRKYCDPDHRVEETPGHKLKKAFWRGVYMPYRSLGGRLKAALNRWQYGP